MLLWMESFDIYGAAGTAKMLDGFYAESSAAGPNVTQVRTGTYSYKYNGGGNAIMRRIFGADKSTVGFGFAIYLNTLPVSSTIVCLGEFRNNANTAVCGLWLTSTGQLQIRTGNSTGAIQGTSAPVIVATAWQHIEIKTTFHSSTGAVEIRVNGQTVLNLSNKNTDTPAGGNAAQVAIYTQSSACPDFYIDDMYAWDTSGDYNNDFIGDKKVYTLWPSADTSVADWVPDSGGVGYSRINEATPNDSSYITAAAASDVSDFAVDNLPSNIAAIVAVQTCTRMLKTDAGSSQVQVSLVSNGANVDGTDRTITTNATYYKDVFEEDPDTNSAWTKSAVDAMLLRATRTV